MAYHSRPHQQYVPTMVSRFYHIPLSFCVYSQFVKLHHGAKRKPFKLFVYGHNLMCCTHIHEDVGCYQKLHMKFKNSRQWIMKMTSTSIAMPVAMPTLSVPER